MAAGTHRVFPTIVYPPPGRPQRKIKGRTPPHPHQHRSDTEPHSGVGTPFSTFVFPPQRTIGISDFFSSTFDDLFDVGFLLRCVVGVCVTGWLLSGHRNTHRLRAVDILRHGCDVFLLAGAGERAWMSLSSAATFPCSALCQGEWSCRGRWHGAFGAQCWAR